MSYKFFLLDFGFINIISDIFVFVFHLANLTIFYWYLWMI